MPHIERPDMTIRRGIPWSLRLMAIAVIGLVIVMRTCSHRSDQNNLHIGAVTIVETTAVSAEIDVPIANTGKHFFENKKILIKLYLQDGTMFKDRLTMIDIPPHSNRDYSFVLEKFDRALKPDEKITAASVEFYHGTFD